MNTAIVESMQKQINKELYSSYLYFSMSSWMERQSLSGFANWLRIQAQEELFHATFMHDYLIRRGAPSLFKGIEEPPVEWGNITALFEEVSAHEKMITASINDMASLALENKDHATYQFLMQYIDEQVEEEEQSGAILEKLKISQCKPEYIYAMDQELAARVYSQPFTAAT